MTSGPQHRHHEVLKIYRHVYHDAVLLSQMDEYLDCTQILPYKSNQSLVIAMKPLPHLGGASSVNLRCTEASTHPRFALRKRKRGGSVAEALGSVRKRDSGKRGFWKRSGSLRFRYGSA
ncbi:hypothetical protein ACLB2K_007213 [Fragaria x ananassa]